MRRQTQEEFNKKEKVELIQACFVEGKQKVKGDIVSVSGNSKVQLLASRRGVRVAVDDRTDMEAKAMKDMKAKEEAEKIAEAKRIEDLKKTGKDK